MPRTLPLALLRPTDHILFVDLKTWFLSVVPVPKPLVHVALGLLVLLLSIVVLRRSPASWVVLIPGLVLSLVMEGFDLWDDKLMINRFQWDESLKDVIVTNLAPLVVVLYNRRAGRSRRRDGAAAPRTGS